MRPAGKIIAALLLAAILPAGYLFLRNAGRWIIGFSTEANQGVVVIQLDSDPARKAKIVFRQAQGFPTAKVILTTPGQSLPRGQIIFFDNTLPPGRVIVEIEGHRLDIMKRAIVVDGIEHAWPPEYIYTGPLFLLGGTALGW